MAKLMTSGGAALARELRRPASAPATAEELAARCPTFEAAEQLRARKAGRCAERGAATSDASCE